MCERGHSGWMGRQRVDSEGWQWCSEASAAAPPEAVPHSSTTRWRQQKGRQTRRAGNLGDPQHQPFLQPGLGTEAEHEGSSKAHSGLPEQV